VAFATLQVTLHAKRRSDTGHRSVVWVCVKTSVD